VLRPALAGKPDVLCLGALALIALVPLPRTAESFAGVSPNGDPPTSVRVALLLKKNATADASVAVIPAGIVPYFSQLRALDVLGNPTGTSPGCRIDPMD
jgi:hypothetical protein